MTTDSTVCVAVIEWGSDYGDRSPGVHVGLDKDSVWLRAIAEVWEFGNLVFHDPEFSEYVQAGTPDLSRIEPAMAWYEGWHDRTCIGWITVSELPLTV